MNEIYTVSSLEKGLLDKRPKSEKRGTMAKNEVFSFQVAYKMDWTSNNIEVKIESPIKDFIQYRRVEFVPVTTPNYKKGDDDMISDKPFLCPDPLIPCKDGHVNSINNAYSYLWFTVKGALPVGRHKIKIILLPEGREALVTEYTLTVLDIELDKSYFTYTNWFHYDGIAGYYKEKVFSKKYNEIVDRYVKCATEHGMNMLLIPMFTPPLDTRVGAERLTVQLIDVTKNGDKYSFDFDRLIEFMKRVQSLGIEYFEMSHLFTQWGVKCAPKIMGRENGRLKRLFGWETTATSEEYENFLSQLLPQLSKRLKSDGLFDKCRFHLSDEPNEKCLENYRHAKKIFKKYMPDGIITDALSHYEFYTEGLVDRAICATDATAPFLQNNVPDLWVYYCCAQSQPNYSNRYMAYPNYRVRVIGMQMYLNNVKGFLQWGYNFYNSVMSDRLINPYITTDGSGGYPSGDAFIVYPGEDGPYDSVRHENFYEGLQDIRLLSALEKKIGREATEALLLENGFEKSFNAYPHSAQALLKIREKAQKLLLAK